MFGGIVDLTTINVFSGFVNVFTEVNRFQVDFLDEGRGWATRGEYGRSGSGLREAGTLMLERLDKQGNFKKPEMMWVL